MDALEDARARLIANNLYIGKNASLEIRQRASGPSLRRALVEDVTLAALGYARSIDADVDQYKELAARGCGLIDGLQFDLSTAPKFVFDGSADPTAAWNFWRHEKRPLDLVMCRKVPRIGRESVEAIASDYVALPYRAAQLERLIIDVLIAAELYAFGDEMADILVARSPLLRFLNSLSDRRKRVIDLLKLMKDAYGGLSSDAVVSTRQLRELATKAADAGVVWPSPLFALLDDNIGRTGRLEPVDQTWATDHW